MPKERIAQIGNIWLQTGHKTKNYELSWYDNAKRQTVTRSTGTADVEQAKLALARYAIRFADLGGCDDSEITLHTLMDRYYEDPDNEFDVRDRKLKTRATLERLKRHIPATMTVNGVTIQWQKELRGKIMAEFGCQLPTAARNVAQLRAVLNWAEKSELIDRAPRFIETKKARPRTNKYDVKTLAKIIDNLETERGFRLFMMVLATGARRRHAVAVTYDRVNFQSRTIDTQIPGEHQRAKRAATVPMCQTIEAHLLRWRQDRMPCVCHWAGAPVKDVVAPINKAMALAGVAKHTAMHAVRRTVAQWLREYQVREADIMGFLGHSPSSMTTMHYAQWDPTCQPLIIEALDAFFAEIQKHTQREIILPQLSEVVANG